MTSLDSLRVWSAHGTPPHVVSPDLARLFAAGVVSRDFREALLANPRAAVAQGYLGQPFDLTEQEQQLLFSIRATSLTDLARQVNRALKGR